MKKIMIIIFIALMFLATMSGALSLYTDFYSVKSGGAFSVIGGGHLSDAAAKLGVRKIDHISLSGGALLEFVAGKKLPGVEVLR